ncbi:hypothetical protein [Salinisphaera aquimarina]|uniref:Uncharacterized protein n=1 Tax=Salinisphaera aquimarina TaxID=2094031 RepID=A0ABV7EM76_9GAMM
MIEIVSRFSKLPSACRRGLGRAESRRRRSNSLESRAHDPIHAGAAID